MNTDALLERLAVVRERIARACDSAGRDPSEVTLIAVSKKHPVEAIMALYEQGVRDFGENYVQEWQAKAPELPQDIRWHFIGHLQSNKVKYLVDDIACIHSVDRTSVIKQLAKQADRAVDVFLQINVAEQDSKFGVPPGQTLELLERVVARPELRPIGLMTMPPYVEDPEVNRPHFEHMRALLRRCQQALASNARGDLLPFDRLSMGMSADFEVAIEEGATHIRVGTVLFGPRSYDD
ncbi:MAG: YggS family pyridoxal phosphate-dependent enzyme [Myxococcota bacterium]